MSAKLKTRWECKAVSWRWWEMRNIFIKMKLKTYKHENLQMGNPLKPIFENKSSATTPTCKTLSWQTESQSPIIDYKFRFRKVPSGNENFRKGGNFMWNQLTIPADRSPGPFHTKSYKLDALAPSTVYEVMIQARNQYGLSEESKILRFATPSEGESNFQCEPDEKNFAHKNALGIILWHILR